MYWVRHNLADGYTLKIYYYNEIARLIIILTLYSLYRQVHVQIKISGNKYILKALYEKTSPFIDICKTKCFPLHWKKGMLNVEYFNLFPLILFISRNESK